MDFMSLDLHLYLNTHPCDAEALKMYNEVTEHAIKARSQYESTYGPMTSFRSINTAEWDWENCPWPWQEAFNFVIDGDV